MSWKHSSGAEGMQNVILWDAVPGTSANRLFKLNAQCQNLCCLLQSGVLEGNAGDCSPIGFSQALGDRVHKSVMHQTRHGHRYGGFFGSSQDQPVVFKSERYFEAYGLESVGSDHAAVVFIGGRGKQRTGEHVEEFVRIDSGFPAT